MSYTQNWIRAGLRIRHWIGLDGAVGYTALARIINIVSSVGTVLLLVKFLTPIEQGYYYTLLSFALFQTALEMGFSFVIQQHAAHDSVRCVFLPDGSVQGDVVAHARLASVLRLALRWYFRAAVVIAAVLLPVGFVFFAHREQAGSHVHWQGPYIVAVLGTGCNFILLPIYAFVEGCGQIREVAAVRFVIAIAVLCASWGAMISGHGLYASGFVNLGAVLVGVAFIARRRRFLLGLLRHPDRKHEVSWRHEVWPFQWRLAVSWFCTYFTTQIFTPVLFSVRGPVEAGRMGMSVNIVAYLPMLVLSWMTTKATPFGQLISQKKLDELDKLFFRTLRQSLLVLVVMAAGCLACVVAVQSVWPKIGTRMEPPLIFLLLLITAVGTYTVQSMAIYLRSFKREPFMIQSAIVSGLTVLAVLVAAPKSGGLGVAIAYLAFSGIGGMISGVAIFRSRRVLHRDEVEIAQEMVPDKAEANETAAVLSSDIMKVSRE